MKRRTFKKLLNKWGLSRKQYESFLFFGINPDEITEEQALMIREIMLTTMITGEEAAEALRMLGRGLRSEAG